MGTDRRAARSPESENVEGAEATAPELTASWPRDRSSAFLETKTLTIVVPEDAGLWEGTERMGGVAKCLLGEFGQTERSPSRGECRLG